MRLKFDDCHDNSYMDIGNYNDSFGEYIQFEAYQEDEEYSNDEDIEYKNACINLRREDAVKVAKFIFETYGIGKRVINK